MKMIADYPNKVFEAIAVLLFMTFLFVPGRKAVAADVDRMVMNLQSNDMQVRLSVLEELDGMKDGKVVDALLNLIWNKGEDWRLKIRAIRLLGEIQDTGVAEELRVVFNDPFLNYECPAMKWYTALALGKGFNKGSRAVDSLIEALNYDNLLVREAVIESLGNIGDSRAVPFLIPALNDKSFAIKNSTIRALESIGDPQAIPFLKRTAENDSDPDIKKEALSVLKNFASRYGVTSY
jgi:HEAT repeat protein